MQHEAPRALVEEAAPTAASDATIRAGAERSVARRWTLFAVLALGLYAGLYAASESLVYRFGEKNRFFAIHAAPQDYDLVILGASHAMPLDFADMNRRLQDATGLSILNLSMEGAGIVPNRIVFDYFSRRRRARTVLWVLDSFAFYSPKWNEERIDDARLFQRAPLDLDLVRVLADDPAARSMLPGYASGFVKINNHDRFRRDISDAELTKFNRTWRAIPQIDRQRVQYLYPAAVDPATFQRYLAEFEKLIDTARERGANVVVVKPPTPPRYRDRLPKEAEFDAVIRASPRRQGRGFRRPVEVARRGPLLLRHRPSQPCRRDRLDRRRPVRTDQAPRQALMLRLAPDGLAMLVGNPGRRRMARASRRMTSWINRLRDALRQIDSTTRR